MTNMRTKRAMRTGSTLIELMMTVSAGTVLMLLAVTMIHQAMNWSELMETRNRDQQSLQRLAEAWRNDCRDGVAIENRTEDVFAIRLSDERRIEYEVRPGLVLRRDIWESSQKTKITGAEQYPFHSRSRFRIEQIDAPKRARLVWTQLPTTGEDSEIVCVVDGVLAGSFARGVSL
jgi:type II secretory pathway component PulJ